jgi:hypothetical protein
MNNPFVAAQCQLPADYLRGRKNRALISHLRKPVTGYEFPYLLFWP